ncbi:hypothetical protein CR513_31351, partial [Mucuna pruriens]
MKEQKKKVNKKMRKAKEKKAIQKRKKQMSFFARESKIKKTFFSNKPMLVLVYNEACLNSKIDPSSLPTSILSLLQDIQDVFPNEIPSGLPSIRGIEYHIDLILGAVLVNRPTYRNRPTLVDKAYDKNCFLASSNLITSKLDIPIVTRLSCNNLLTIMKEREPVFIGR